MHAYRGLSRPSADRSRAPSTVISVSVIAADTDERAEWLAGSIRWKVLSRWLMEPSALWADGILSVASGGLADGLRFGSRG